MLLVSVERSHERSYSRFDYAENTFCKHVLYWANKPINLVKHLVSINALSLFSVDNASTTVTHNPCLTASFCSLVSVFAPKWTLEQLKARAFYDRYSNRLASTQRCVSLKLRTKIPPWFHQMHCLNSNPKAEGIATKNIRLWWPESLFRVERGKPGSF